ncbi:hypothetical protein PAMP_010009 [Pampus punctatissimus]
MLSEREASPLHATDKRMYTQKLAQSLGVPGIKVGILDLPVCGSPSFYLASRRYDLRPVVIVTLLQCHTRHF